MILLCGIPSESPLAMVANALGALGAEHRVLNQRHVAAMDIDWQIDAGGINRTLPMTVQPTIDDHGMAGSAQSQRNCGRSTA